MCNAALMHVEIPRRRDATELRQRDEAVRHHIHYQTEAILSIFPKDNDDSSFCSNILLVIDLQCHVFPFEKLLLNVCVNGIFDDMTSSPRNDVEV